MSFTYNAIADHLRFIRALIADPHRIAAIAPSSNALAQLITSEISPFNGPVLELGPGTGVFTRALLARGLRSSDLTLIEQGVDFARRLHIQFPEVRVLRMDATNIASSDLFPYGSVTAVVSGLPLLSMPPRKVIRVLAGAFAYLQHGGAFYHFTYGLKCPVPRPILDRLGLKARRIGGTLRNLPPASVYRITRRGPFETILRTTLKSHPCGIGR
ncbi:methyltransferase domain-containing protein [Rhizobium sp. CB3090]|uniref:class I SAM-dependent methyltransferase n=1 Tax=Rhizobium sp. CB3090 TaxID=3039156 RepID=UPI0024B257FF|nr:methyltransferase domain-containing protein [Rhizobium sp. CB3090]WFU10321.1 methyltransferase domain-containing protein [Rhizobium sp. CB3090]